MQICCSPNENINIYLTMLVNMHAMSDHLCK